MENKSFVCDNCGAFHNGTYGSGRFCSEKCSRSFSTKRDNKKELKEARCVICGDLIYINKRASLKKCKCKKCKKKNKKCKICGGFYNSDVCEKQFCKKHNYRHFKTLIKYFGFDKSKYGTSCVEKEFNRVRNLLYDLYWNKNYSTTDIANMFNYKSEPTNIAQKFFKYLNIPVKKPSRAVTDNFLTGRMSLPKNNNTYVCGWHTTWDNNSVYLRSSYEFDFAKELDDKKIHYEVEKIRIRYFDTTKNDYRCALPDFYIPETNTIYEIKSEYTYNKVEMDDKFKEYKNMGYNCVLVLEHKEIKV